MRSNLILGLCAALGLLAGCDDKPKAKDESAKADTPADAKEAEAKPAADAKEDAPAP